MRRLSCFGESILHRRQSAVCLPSRATFSLLIFHNFKKEDRQTDAHAKPRHASVWAYSMMLLNRHGRLRQRHIILLIRPDLERR